MKLILSRKGFDSSAGGCPSPVFPDGRAYALPIPDPRSRVTYNDLDYDVMNVGKLVRDLTGHRRAGSRGAHLDPDLLPGVFDRAPGWTPCLGQSGSAQGHLIKQGVGPGDLFLFFGLFRQVTRVGRRYSFAPGSKPFHGLWGWLQIGSVNRVDDLTGPDWQWASYHPHVHGQPDPRNTLYLAANSLDLGNASTKKSPGSGVFATMKPEHRLTAPNARNVTQWQLPSCFYPTSNADALSYHQNLDRWSFEDGVCTLKSAARGQEFVVNTADKPSIREWAHALIAAEERP